MKKLLVLFVCFILINSVAFPNVEYVGDTYYPDKGYFETKQRNSGVGERNASIGITFRTINGTDKVVIVARHRSDNIMTVSKMDKVLLRFTDGKELELSYNSRVSQYDSSRFELTATSGIIEDFGTLEIVRMNTDDGYLNFKASKKQAKKLINDFNMIKEQATAKYGNKETTE